MVSQHRASPDSRGRLLAAAAAEFAARGFDGAKVDRIAARARVNKAMLYYHFHNKAALYREILHDVFASLADAVEAVRAAGGTPDRQVRAFVRAVADGALARPHFPGMWLREMADGGRHLDEGIVAELRRVVQALAAILHDGHLRRRFQIVHPLLAQMSIVGPLLLFDATEPVRRRFHDLLPAAAADLSRDVVVAHIQHASLAALARSSSRPRTKS